VEIRVSRTSTRPQVDSAAIDHRLLNGFAIEDLDYQVGADIVRADHGRQEGARNQDLIVIARLTSKEPA
jgi:hypothetical protein